jgi:hypothetical protein
MTPKEELITTSEVMPSESKSIQNRIDLIIELDKKLIEINSRIKDNKWDSLKDSRVLFIRYLSELNSDTILQMSFQAETHGKTSDKTWLKDRLPHLSEQVEKITDIKKYAENRDNNILSHTWDCFILSYFIEFETRLRSIVRNIGKIENVYATKSKKKLNGNEAFHLIYRGIYESFLRIRKTDYEVLKVFSAIRNTIHNSGFYFSASNEDATFHYRDKSYHFKNGYPVNFLTAEFIKTLLLDLLELFSKTISNKKISNIDFIKDPISEVKFKKLG